MTLSLPERSLPADIEPERAPARSRPTSRRATSADRMLTALERLVHRHRSLALHSEYVDLHAELIAAEVALELAVLRSALHHPAA